MKRDSKRRDDRGGRDFGQRGQMFEAICAECGQKCEVPFKPTGDKPVYCSNCFTARQGSQPRRDDRGGRDFGRPRFRDRDRQMFSAICDKCGKECQVPFQPTPGKPIFCDQCFDRGGKATDRGGDRGGAPKGDQLASINAKLDKIINALIVAKIIKPAKEEKAVKEVKSEIKKPVAKKKVSDKKAGKKKK